MGKKDEKIGTCALCGKHGTLENSHILPKFVIRKMKKSSITGNLRVSNAINRKIQDGIKEYMLCGECEDRFNISETKFANKVFHPYAKGDLKEAFEYEDWLAKFIVSVHWRFLYYEFTKNILQSEIEIDDLELLIKNESVLREFLLDERDDIGDCELNMFFFNDIVDAYDEIRYANPHSFYYLSTFQDIDIQIIEKEKSISIITSLCGIFTYTILKKCSFESSLNTVVNLDKGIFKPYNQNSTKQGATSRILSEVNYLNNNLKKQLSTKQKNAIEESLEKNKKKIENSEHINCFKKDLELKNTDNELD